MRFANSKKGQQSPVIVVTVGLTVALAVLIFLGIFGGNIYNFGEPTLNLIGDRNQTNESVTLTNGTAASLSQRDLHNANIIIQFPGSIQMPSTNFTVGLAAGTLTMNNNRTFAGTGVAFTNTTTFNVTYRWGYDKVASETRGVVASGLTGLKSVGDYAVFVILGVVFGLVVMFFTMGSGRRMGGGAI